MGSLNNILPLLYLGYYFERCVSIFKNTLMLKKRFLILLLRHKHFFSITLSVDGCLLHIELRFFLYLAHLHGLTLYVEKCHILSFSWNRIPLLHDFFLHGIQLHRVFSINDLNTLCTPSLHFRDHLNAVAKKALKDIGFVLILYFAFINWSNDSHFWVTTMDTYNITVWLTI